MILTFNLSEADVLAMSEQYYKDSPSHQRVRNRTRWLLPMILIPMAVVLIGSFGFNWPSFAVLVVAATVWWIVAPRRFDATVSRFAQKQMKESSYSKSFGKYTIEIAEEHLVSNGPTGSTQYKWSCIDRAVLKDGYLFLFLAGPAGLPIRTSEIGIENATLALGRIQKLIELSNSS